MINILKSTEKDAELLAEIGKISFIESHGNSASAEDLNSYVIEKYTTEVFEKDMADAANVYHIIYYNNIPAGYSKIIYNIPHPNVAVQNISKLERIYLLKEFYNLKLGHELLQFNKELSQNNNQAGMWLNVWIGNHRAVNFYLKSGFQIVGSYNFRISDTHSNPNHQMYLAY